MKHLFVLLALLSCGMAAQAQPGELRWGGDAEGGAPFVEADPEDPSRLQGFDVEVAELLARSLGRTPRFVQVAYASIDASVERGDFDVGLCGIEQTPGRCSALACTIPYYEFREVLTVREGDRERYRTLSDLRGRKVGTLGGTIAYDLLLKARERHGLEVVSYDDDVHPYEDLAAGRLDAVLLDNIIADRALRRTSGLVIQPGAEATGHYVGVLAASHAELRDRLDEALREGMRDGSLERIFRRWGIWDDAQTAFFERTLAPAPAQVQKAGPPSHPGSSRWELVARYLPALLRASLITLVLSCLAMALAVGCGIAIAVGRVYGGPLLRSVLTGYVELMRGTPLLLQLFVLYYGLSDLVRLPAFAAALLGLGLNYAAFESEIYRAALEAVPTGQLEAARTLGFTERQVLRLVRGPQALRLALAPMTNDFVALLKDSSLVSVITVVELTKQTAIFATNIGSWVVPGALCATLYLLLSLPLSRLARRLERRWKVSPG
ncbi:ABC transporter substrate-binding protein/permease [Myxococcaceae bacterium GXIMD 01537]